MIDILTPEQSEFLKRVRDQEVFKENLTSDERNVFKFLKGQEFVKEQGPLYKEWDEKTKPLVITERGKQYLEWESHYYLSLTQMEEEIEAIRKMAEIADANAKSSAEEAQRSKKRANTANWIAFFALVVSVLSWIFPF